MTSECYVELNLNRRSGNKGKVMVCTKSSNNPLKFENETDLSHLITFFGQVRDRLIIFLMDRHESLVSDIML